MAAAVVAADAKECKGKFISGRNSELVDSDVVFEASQLVKTVAAPEFLSTSLFRVRRVAS